METYGFGGVPSPRDIRDYKLSAAAMQPHIYPESFLLKPVRIKNQDCQPTCTAHALASLVEFFNYQETYINDKFSTDFIYGCRTDDDYLGEGMYLRDGLKVLQKYGDVLYDKLPGNTDVPTARKKVFTNFDQLVIQAEPNKVNTYYKIQNIQELKHALVNDGPVPAVMKWFKSATLINYVYTYPTTQVDDYHAVLIVGWDKDCLIIQNSWGKKWGKNGLFYIPISKMNEVFSEMYGVTDNQNDVVLPKPSIKKFSFLINFILRLVDKLFNKA